MSLNSSSKLFPSVPTTMSTLPQESQQLFPTEIDEKIKQAKEGSLPFPYQLRNKIRKGEKRRARQMATTEQSNSKRVCFKTSDKLTAIRSAIEAFPILKKEPSEASFEIQKLGIASIKFVISLDRNRALVEIMKNENRSKFYKQQERVQKIFGSVVSYYTENSISIEIGYGRYSETTLKQIKETINILGKKFRVNSFCRNEIFERVEELVSQVKIECQQETATYEHFLADFTTNIANPYKALNYDALRVVNGHLDKLHCLISEVEEYRGNPMKVGSRWVHLLLCEGFLDTLISFLGEYNIFQECFLELSRGVTNFLKSYEEVIHVVIEKQITKDSVEWFQNLYTDYKLMVETGRFPTQESYGPFTNMNLVPYRLFLPNRFVKPSL